MPDELVPNDLAPAALAPAALAPADPWHALRALTPARIALGRAGGSLPTRVHLEFQLAHARARDAVHDALDVPALTAALAGSSVLAGFGALMVRSAAGDRARYLQRPDLGRRLEPESRARLEQTPDDLKDPGALFVAGDGLSARAAQRHAVPLLAALVPALAGDGWRIGPVVVAEGARVALGDEIGGLLRARLVVILIGERPGLSSPDSLGAYLTWAPRPGRTDAERNCVSNIRPEGLAYDSAAARLRHLVVEARRRRLSGVALKDESGLLGA